jgi:hypothetical protein
MGEPASKGLRRFVPALWVTLAWLGVWFTADRFVGAGAETSWHELTAFLERFAFKAFGGFPAAQSYAVDLVRVLRWGSHPALAALATWAALVVPLGFVARIMARARLRSGAADPLDRLRTWTAAHPRWTRAIVGALPALWGLFATGELLREVEGSYDMSSEVLSRLLPIALASALLQYAGARSVVRSFLAPTVDPTEESRIEIGPDEIAFDAVAVTREARAAVAGLAGVSLAMTVWIAALPIAVLFHDPRLFAAVAVYAGVALVGATAFRMASRVAVGVDGVLVKGTSRTRFFAYRDLDGVRVVRGDVELLRRGKAVLRLQLHGADAIRRDAVTARIRENIERVQRGEGAVAAQLVSSSTKDALARVASGGADYRAASLSREALWALIEGPAVDAGARRAAAEALSRTSDERERVRLRVAAEHCADPEVRIALTELAAEGELSEHGEPVGAASALAAERRQ